VWAAAAAPAHEHPLLARPSARPSPRRMQGELIGSRRRRERQGRRGGARGQGEGQGRMPMSLLAPDDHGGLPPPARVSDLPARSAHDGLLEPRTSVSRSKELRPCSPPHPRPEVSCCETHLAQRTSVTGPRNGGRPSPPLLSQPLAGETACQPAASTCGSKCAPQPTCRRRWGPERAPMNR
jgi:hypothetical protein